jgi:hypothetical protein
MSLSFFGLLVCGVLMLMALPTRAPILVALIMSFAFGATAFVSLSALGGSSPMIYVVFVMALLVSVALYRDINRDLTTVFTHQPTAWLLVLIGMYAVVGAYLMPRMFAGETTMFIPEQAGGGIVEVLLYPSNGNITQTAYLLLGILTSIAVSVVLLDRRAFGAIRQGYFALAGLHVALGLVDILGKLAGAGDVLAPIRTASYAMLTDAGVAGFWRITGAYSEASGFGAATVALLAFMFTYWRRTQDRLALGLSIALAVLLVLSTSSTAYVGGAVLGLFLLGSIVVAILRNRMRQQDLLILFAGVAMLVALVGMVIVNEHILDPILNLFDKMILNKVSSTSGEERAYWNSRSLQALYDTAGLGIGLGSSRASSWAIAVVSQLGVIGSAMIGWVVLTIARSGRMPGSEKLEPGIRDVALSVRAACLAGLVTASISSGSADPGVPFFVGAAVVLSYRRLAQEALRSPAGMAAPLPAAGVQA